MASDTGPRPAGYPTRPASALQPGDLIHLGSLTFVLVAGINTGTDTVDGWVEVTLYDPERLGLRPSRPSAHLSYRPDQSVRIAHRGVQLSGSTTPADQPHENPCTVHAVGWGANSVERGVDDVDLDRVARLVRAAGIDCVIDVVDHASATAVLLAGRPTAVPDWAHPWRAHAGPAVRGRGGRCTATTRTLAIGPHDAGATTPIRVADVGAVTEEQIAALVIAQTCTPTTPLTSAAVSALGLHPPKDH